MLSMRSEASAGSTAPKGLGKNLSSSLPAQSIAETARRLSWKRHVVLERNTESDDWGRADAKPEFIEAALALQDDVTIAYFTDCGVFVASVVHLLGLDPDFPVRETWTQFAYVKDSNRWETFVPAGEGDLRPGDILVREGHIYIYVGEYWSEVDERHYRAVGASLYTRPPSGHHLYLTGKSSKDRSSDQPFSVARFRGDS